MRRSRIKPDYSWPGWRYGPDGEAEIFQCAEDVPEGWYRTPGEVREPFIQRQYITPPSREVLLKELEAKGIEIDPTWGVAHMKKVLDS